jgi:hypothetical protein
MPFDPDEKPRPVQVPVDELLGSGGHRYCTGWQLEAVDGKMNLARKCRDAWIGTPEKRAHGLPEPKARPVETFESGMAVFVIGHKTEGDGYEVATMYPRPPENER